MDIIGPAVSTNWTVSLKNAQELTIYNINMPSQTAPHELYTRTIKQHALMVAPGRQTGERIQTQPPPPPDRHPETRPRRSPQDHSPDTTRGAHDRRRQTDRQDSGRRGRRRSGDRHTHTRSPAQRRTSHWHSRSSRHCLTAVRCCTAAMHTG